MNSMLILRIPRFRITCKTMRAAGADVQYVSIPSNGVWYDHIGIDKERRQAVYKKFILLL